MPSLPTSWTCAAARSHSQSASETEPPRYGGAALAHALHVRGRLLVAEARRARQLREQ
jgi:hypothetical protein